MDKENVLLGEVLPIIIAAKELAKGCYEREENEEGETLRLRENYIFANFQTEPSLQKYLKHVSYDGSYVEAIGAGESDLFKQLNGGGKKYTKSNKKVGRNIIYIGPRGGKYIKKDGAFVKYKPNPKK